MFIFYLYVVGVRLHHVVWFVLRQVWLDQVLHSYVERLLGCSCWCVSTRSKLLEHHAHAEVLLVDPLLHFLAVLFLNINWLWILV